MTISKAGLRDLIKSIETADDKRILSVSAYVERLVSGPDVSRIRDIVRPRLQRLHAARVMTFDRLCILPIEDLLVPIGEKRSGPGHIDRQFIDPILETAKAGLPPEELRAYEARLRNFTTRDLDSILSAGDELWPRLAEVFRARQAAAKSAKARSAQAMASVSGLVALMMTIAPGFIRLLSKLPAKPMANLVEEHLKSIAVTLVRLEAQSKGAALMAFRALLARSGEPGTLMPVLEDPALGLSDEQQATVLVDCIDMVAGRLEAEAERFAATKGLDLANAAEFLRHHEMAKTSADAYFSVAHKEKLAQSRETIAGKVKEVLEDTKENPAVKARLAKVEAGAVQPEDAIAMEETMRSLGRIRRSARELKIEGSVEQTVRGMTRSIEEATRRAVSRKDADPAATGRLVVRQARLIELMHGGDAAKAFLQSFNK